jgi:hypothetical protein
MTMKRVTLLIVMIFTLVMSAGQLLADEVTIGTGGSSNATPINTGVGSSLFQGLYYPDELNMAAGTSVTGLKIYTGANPWGGPVLNHQTKIWIGNTTQASMWSGWIPLASLTQVFDGTVDLLFNSTISFTFSAPFVYTGDNLVIYVARPSQPTSMGYLPFDSQTLGSTRAVMALEQMMGGPLNPASPPMIDGMMVSPTGVFPRTTFVYSAPAMAADLAALSVSGAALINSGVNNTYNVAVKNNGTDAQNSYQVKLFANDIEVASVSGTPIDPDQTLGFNLDWTPAADGGYLLYGKVVLAGDGNATNDQSASIQVHVLPVGVAEFVVGTGGSTNKYPLDVDSAHSLFETVYYPSEVGPAGTIYGMKFFNNFQQAAINQLITIWMGESANDNLTAGWIPSGSLTQVFYGTVNLPAGQNEITIFFDTPYTYNGGNLVLMVYRPTGNVNNSFMNSDVFITQTRRVDNTRFVSGFGMETIDPADPSGGSVTGEFPQSGFYKLDDNQTLPVELSSFSAVLTAEQYVRLNWVTQSETNLIGFRAYRSESNELSQAVMVSGLIDATNTSTTQSYDFTDTEVESGSTYYYWLESVDLSGSEYYGWVSVTVTGGDDGNAPPVYPEATALRNAFPNPVSEGGVTTIQVYLKAGDFGTVGIYNVRGQMIRSFTVSEGYQNINWNGRDNNGRIVSCGVYFYKLTTRDRIQTKKLIILE